jgi:ABC-type amino acid transport substrate-binding protein
LSGSPQAILTEETARNIAVAAPGLKVVVLNTPGEAFSIVFPKGSPLVGPVNEALKKMKDDLQAIEAKWIAK